MSKLTRFDPFSEVARMDPFRGVENFFKGFDLRPAWSDMNIEPRIKMDVTESDQAYTVKAEIPGVKKEDIKVDIEGNQVSISAEARKESEEKKGDAVVRSERYYGKQFRSFTLGADIDEAKSEATYRDGVLELTLPKKKNGSGVHKLNIN